MNIKSEGMVRFDKRTTPFLRVWTMMKTRVLSEKPAWFDAVRAFPPVKLSPSWDTRVYRDPPELEFLEDRLLDLFHRRYRQRFGTNYVGINHLADLKDGRPWRSYRDEFVKRQALLMQKTPGLTAEKAYNMIFPQMEDYRKAERNKMAIQTRWILDSKSENLDKSMIDLTSGAEEAMFRRAVKIMGKKLKAEKRLYRAMSGENNLLEPYRALEERRVVRGEAALKRADTIDREFLRSKAEEYAEKKDFVEYEARLRFRQQTRFSPEMKSRQ